MNNLFNGVHYLIAGFSLMTKPGLKRFILIPLLINILFFVGLFFLSRYFISEFNTWFATILPTWLQWLSIVLWVLFLISFFIVFVYAFVTVANLISAPFNSFLSEKVEWYLTGNSQTSRSLWENIKDIPRIIGRQFSILGFYLPRALAILLLFFIPIVQAVAAILWFIFSAWFMTLTYVDYPTDNHRIPIEQVKIKLRAKKWVALGFGIAVLVVAMIPVLNFFVIPAAVAGATKMWLEELR